jgi:hypothetical protein
VRLALATAAVFAACAGSAQAAVVPESGDALQA